MLLLNNKPIKYFTFPGGEYQVNLDDLEAERAILTWKPSGPEHITLLLLTVNALKHQGCSDIIIDCIYLPYARQDRVCAPGQSFSLEVIVKLLDDMDVSAIHFWDIHNSDLTLSMFRNTYVQETEIYDIFSHYKILDGFDLDNLILCAPDIGAGTKVDDVVKKFELGNAIHFEKDRDPETGQIHGIIPNEYNRDFDGYNILVVDDICDGGSTFIDLAKELRKHTNEDLYLYVTHGIFSKGFSELLQYYKHIFCHHVLHDYLFQSNEHLTILREFPHVP